MNTRRSSTPIAVIGLGCWYPGAQSPQLLWENILSCRRQFRQIPACRLPLEDYYDADKKAPDKTYGRMASLIDGFVFDWATRRIPQSTCLATDMVHWLAFETTLQAVADAGFDRSSFPKKRTGVIVGNSLTGEHTRSYTLRLRWPYVRKVLLAAALHCELSPGEISRLEQVLENYYKSAFPPPNEDALAGGLSNTIAGRICNYLDTDGGGYTVDGACSSSLLAVVTAAVGLSSGDLDLALAGGVDISLDPFELIGFSKAGALAAGEMTVYDRRASGFIPGEGCGFVVLKRYADAVRDGNQVYAVLHGWGISSDGGAAAITAPSVRGQALALERAYANAGYGIETIDFIEGHGTGTAVGDRIELEAVESLTSQKELAPNTARRFCGMTSLKSIIGHTKAAAGIGAFIKAVMAVNRRVCPPIAGCRYPNPIFEQAARSIYPVRMGKVYSPAQKLRAGISAMGFGGINCHVTIESADPPSRKLAPIMDEHMLMASAQENEIFVLSADDTSQIITRIDELLALADGISYAELSDLAAQLGREANSGQCWRAALIAGDPDGLVQKLQKLLSIFRQEPIQPGAQYEDESEDIWVGNRITPPRVGIVFPGQGSQKLNMARVLVARYPWARELLQVADQLSLEFGTTPLSRMLYPPTDQAEDSRQIDSWFQALSGTQYAQPAICLTSALWYRFLGELGITPVAVGGHSLGEATAFYAAGAFDEVTLLRFAFARGQAMVLPQQKPGAMLSLQCSRRQAEDLLRRVGNGYLVLANINAPNQMIASGEAGAIDQLNRQAAAQEIQTRRLRVSNAFHCRLMAPAAEKLARNNILPPELSNPKARLFSCIDGQEIVAGQDLREYFSRQVTAPVNFVAMLESLAGCSDIMIEVGPGRALTGLANAIAGRNGLVCLPTEPSPLEFGALNRLLAKLFVSGTPIKWDALYTGRLVRPFIPARKRAFLSNPCEKPLDIDGLDSATRQTGIAAPSASRLSELADLPAETIRTYLNQRGAFLADMIRADLKHGLPSWKSGAPDNYAANGGGTRTCEKAACALANGSAADSLFELIAKATGFPKETLTPDLRLLDDLNLDSIKSGDIIARYAEQLGLSGQVDPAGLANASLGEIVDRVTALASASASTPQTTGRTLDPTQVLDVLIDQTSQITGLPRTDIAVDAALGGDLQLGSDQLRRLLTASSTLLGLPGNLDLQPLLSCSLKRFAEILVRIALREQAAEAQPSIPLTHSWVREMRVDLLESKQPDLPPWYGKRVEDNWSNAQILILGDDPQDQVCQALARRLESSGAAVRVRSFDESETQAFRDSVEFFSHFIVVLPRTPQESDFTRYHLKQAISRLSTAAVPPPAARAPRRRNCLVFVQFGGGYFGTRSDAAVLSRCCAGALAKSVHLERHDLKTRVIDFAPELAADLVAEKAILEMQLPENFAEVGYDDQLCRRTSVVCPIEPAEYDPDPTSWSQQDVILVTGGAKGITAECALALARATGARMALLGRTALGLPGERNPQGEKIRGLLNQYQQEGLQAGYYACDVCDRDSVAETVGRIQQDLGKISGVIHGAGLNIPRRIHQVSAEQALQEVAPKVLGALNLLDALQADPPKLIVGLTSIIGITGMPGNGWYAFSNEALDIILRRYEADHPRTRTLSVAYSIWRDQGMGARMGSVAALQQKGIDAIPTEEGVKRFIRLFLQDPGTHQVMVTARLGRFDTVGTQPAPTFQGYRYLERLVHYTPGIESAFLIHLSLAEDLYLKDHSYNGSYLFPTVFGLEAMAQVIAHVTGVTEFDTIRVEDLLLQRPITVDPERGADIIVWAQCAERLSDKEQLCVRAGIFKLGADSKSDFFSARFLLGMDSLAARPCLNVGHDSLDIKPATDLYRSTLLFQGSRFQRIDTVYELERQGNDSGTVLLGTKVPEQDPAKLAFASGEHQILLLGDPFQRDVLLQSAALLIPQDTSLPIAVGRWDIHCCSVDQDRLFVQTRLTAIREKEVQVSVTSMTGSGAVSESLEGYRLKILQHHEDYPTVSDLLHPEKRDTRILQERFARLAGQLKLQIPRIAVSHLPGLHELPKERRRELERPLFRKVVESRIRADALPIDEFAIQWQPNGKPVVSCSDRSVQVSLAHDDRYCITAAEGWSQGCDIIPVTPRSLDQWIGLLGPTTRDLIDDQLAGDDLDRRCTALWAAREVLNKVGVNQIGSIEIERQAEDALLFRCNTDNGEIKILAAWIRLTRGRERAVAFTTKDIRAQIRADEGAGIDYPGYEALFNRQHYKIIEGGPQGQGIFIYRLPVTFMPAGQLSRHVYFSHYFFWAGTVREASAWPVLGKIASQFATGQWGGVTNFADLKVLGEATTHDLIEVWMWASGNGGPQNSVLDLTYDFRKVLPDGGYERLAWLEQQTTWVRILEHGIARVEPYPDYYATFLADMLPRYDAPNLPECLPEPLTELTEFEGEDYLYIASPGPTGKPILHSHRIETSLEDANIVGNIYFANYYAWQGRVRDRYFYTLIPDYFRGTGDSGELLCLRCRVDHLREAMPFDVIEVQMALIALKSCYATLYFEYFKFDSDGHRLKLATGTQNVVWVQRDHTDKRPLPRPFPPAVHEAFRLAIARHQQRKVVNM